MCGARTDDRKQAGIRILLETDIPFGQLRILHVVGRFHRKEPLEVIDQSEIHGAIMHRDQIAASAGLHFSGFECDRLQVFHRIAFAAVLSIEFLHRLVGLKTVRLLNRLLIRNIIRVGSVFIAVQCSIFICQEGLVIYIIHIPVLLILDVLVDHTVVCTLLVPYVVRLEDNASLDAGVHQEHDHHNDDKKRED